ncbi:MAG TPA: hypothetical protein VGD91_27240 [Trebonia sp.]
MKTGGKALYEKSRAQAKAKGVPDLPGIGDSAFKAGTDQSGTLLFLKGTTLVSILFGGTAAQASVVAVARIAARKLYRSVREEPQPAPAGCENNPHG